MKSITITTKWNRCFLFHRWKKVSDNGFTKYFICKDCTGKRVEQPEDGYQPIDSKWFTDSLGGGKDLLVPVPSPSADISQTR